MSITEENVAYVESSYSTPVRRSEAKTTAPIYCREGQTVGEALADRSRSDTASRIHRTEPRSVGSLPKEVQTSNLG